MEQLYGGWQCCPKCNGQGTVSKPPYLAGDINEWLSTQTSFQCDVCNGQKIIQKPLIGESNQDSSSLLKEIEELKKKCEADHCSIDELLSEFNRRGINTENWDGDNFAEAAIVSGVKNHIESTLEELMNEVGRLKKEEERLEEIIQLGEISNSDLIEKNISLGKQLTQLQSSNEELKNKLAAEFNIIYQMLVIDIPYYAYGDHEAACSLADQINHTREYIVHEVLNSDQVSNGASQEKPNSSNDDDLIKQLSSTNEHLQKELAELRAINYAINSDRNEYRESFEYYKLRCEAAEDCLACLGKMVYKEAYVKWQALKNQTPKIH